MREFTGRSGAKGLGHFPHVKDSGQHGCLPRPVKLHILIFDCANGDYLACFSFEDPDFNILGNLLLCLFSSDRFMLVQEFYLYATH